MSDKKRDRKTKEQRPADRLQLNDQTSWDGPDCFLGTVDELVLHEASLHVEMLDNNVAMLVARTAIGEVRLNVCARPTTRRERRALATAARETLRDELFAQRGWRHPVLAVSDWWQTARARRAVLRIVAEDDTGITG